jgi:hypothetical protein
VALVRTDVSEEIITSVIKLKRISELGSMLVVTSYSVLQLSVTINVVPNQWIVFTLMTEATHYSETSVLTKSTRRYIPEDGILFSHRHENLKSGGTLF